MQTRIGIISDVHACPRPLQQALDLFAGQHVSEVICAGDIAGYFDELGACINLLKEHQCKTIIGNHDQSYLQSHSERTSNAEIEFLQSLPEIIELEIQGLKILVVHAEPPSAQHGGIKLLDQQGKLIPGLMASWQKKLSEVDCDVLIVGHTHQVYAEKLGHIFVVNPGSSRFNHSCMVLSLPDLQVQTFALDDKPVIKSWNFSRLFQYGEGYPQKSSY